MDRISAADWIDIGGGRRGFRDENLPNGLVGTVVDSLFLNAVQEEIMAVIEASGQVPNAADWTQLLKALDARIASRWITADMTLTIGPGETHTTIASALSWLATRPIASTATVTLALTAGQHIVNATNLTIDHPYGQRIHLKGAPMLGADPVAADFACTGNTPAIRAANAATNLAMLRAKYASEIRFTGGARLDILGGGLGLIDDLLVSSDGSAATYGVYIDSAVVTFGTFSMHGAGDDGIVPLHSRITLQAGGVVTASGCAMDGIELTASLIENPAPARMITVGNGGVGFEMTHSSSSLITGPSYCAGNGIRGVQIQIGSAAYFADLTARLNSSHGVYAASNALIAAAVAVASDNGGHGVLAAEDSTFSCSALTANANTMNGVHAMGGSYAAVPGSTLNTNTAGATSPAANTVGNDRSYVRRP